MRLPFPERVPLFPTMIFCLVLCSLQQVEGTSLLFSAGTFCFIVISALAFNLAGGLTRPSGSWIFAYSLMVVIIGITYKVIVGEPGQSNLQQPEKTIEIYVATITALLAAVYVNRRLRLKRSRLPQFKSDSDMYRAAVGCLLLGTAGALYGTFWVTGNQSGSFYSAFQQFNAFLPLAMILGVTCEVRKSGGRRSVNIPVFVSAFLMFAFGVMGYSKQGMFTPFVCWVIPAAAQRLRVSIVQVAAIALSFAFVSYYLVPYSQYGRGYKIPDASFSKNLQTNILLLSNLGTVRKLYLSNMETLYATSGELRYYNQPQGLADRLQMITPDDAVINITENGSVYGIEPTLWAFEDLIPHFIWPGKPLIPFNNIYAHEIGIIVDEDDTTTGISFSPSGEAFHQAKWVGILVMLPILALIMFFIQDSVAGDTRASPFALLILIGDLHGAPEAGLTQFVASTTRGTVGLYVIAYITVFVTPLIANLIMGPAKRKVSAAGGISPRPGRFVRVERPL